MKLPVMSCSKIISGFSLVLCLAVSCDQPKKAVPPIENPDSLSVKKMGTDSNSDMPVHIPKDSTEKIPNPLKQ